MKTNFKVSKKIISLVLTALLVLSMISVSGFSAFAEVSADILPELSATIDTGEEITLSDADGDGYYDINNADELYAFAALVNDGNTAINGKILKDFVVNEGLLTSESTDVRAWTPIGNNSNRYSGTFDGNGCVVAGLYFNDSSAFDIGFFGCIGASGVVKNIEVNANYFCASSFVGGIAGMNIGVITDCINNGYVIGGTNAGGVVGSNIGEIINCHNNTAVTGTDNVGGVAGTNNQGKITGSYSIGDVSASGSCVGGVVGDNYEGEIINCYNSGLVAGDFYVGGVAGNSDGNVTNCYNTGTVSGTQNRIGGVIGREYGTTQNCYYLDTAYNGGIGMYGTTKAEDIEGSAEAKTAEQFASGEVAYLLQGRQDEIVWGQLLLYLSTAEDSPTLYGERVYKATDCIGNVIYSNSSDNAQHKYKMSTCENCGDCRHMRVVNQYCRYCNTYITHDIVAGYSIGLGDKIAVSYYMSLCEETLNDQNAKVVLTVPDTNNTNTVEIPVSSVTPNKDGHYVFTCEVAAKEMTSVIELQVITSKGESNLYDYTVKDYAEVILSDTETYAKEQELVKKMLNYGANAQNYFDYKTYSLANDTELMTEEERVTELYGFAGAPFTLEGEESGVTYYGTALSLETELVFKHYFIIDESVDANSLEITCDYPATLKKNGSFYELIISDIPAHKMGENSLKVSLGGITLDYTIYSYGALAQNSGKEALWTVVSALAHFAGEATMYAYK